MPNGDTTIWNFLPHDYIEEKIYWFWESEEGKTIDYIELTRKRANKMIERTIVEFNYKMERLD